MIYHIKTYNAARRYYSVIKLLTKVFSAGDLRSVTFTLIETVGELNLSSLKSTTTLSIMMAPPLSNADDSKFAYLIILELKMYLLVNCSV